MCCHGCKAVAEAIVAAGLTDFYRHRTAPSRRAEDLIPEPLRGLELYDRPDLQQSFVRTEGEHVREAALMLEGIVCAACVWLIENSLKALPGVAELVERDGRWQFVAADLPALLALLARLPVRDVTIQPPSLEEVFLSYYRVEDGA